MSTLVFPPTTGRNLSLTNRTANRVGCCGVVINANDTVSVPFRKIQGHKDYMTELGSLIDSHIVQATLVSDILSSTDADVLDAPVSGEIWLTRDVWNNAVTNDVDGIRTSWTATAAANTYTGTDLNGVVGTSDMDYARNVTVTGVTGGGEALLEKDVILVGTNINDQAQTETLTVSTGNQGGGENVTYRGVYAFKNLVSAYFPGDASAPAGAYSIGFGKKFGFSRPLTQGGLVGEFEDNAAIATGTVVLAATGLPNGTYSPANNPNGARDWVVMFIQS